MRSMCVSDQQQVVDSSRITSAASSPAGCWQRTGLLLRDLSPFICGLAETHRSGWSYQPGGGEPGRVGELGSGLEGTLALLESMSALLHWQMRLGSN